MLTFNNARDIFLSYPELTEKKVDSQSRYGYDFHASKQRGKNVISEFCCNLNGSCNGYVNSRYMPEIVINKYRNELDKRLMICFKSYTQNKLRELVNDALKVMR